MNASLSRSSAPPSPALDGPAHLRFQCARPRAAEDIIGNLFEPSQLSVSEAAGFDFSLDHFPCGPGVSISRLAFKADVQVRIDRVKGFMVQMPMAGRNDIEVGGGPDGGALSLSRRLFSVIGPDRSVRQHRFPDCEMLLVRIDDARMAECLTAHLGDGAAPDSRLDFDLRMAPQAEGAAWLRLTSYLFGELHRDSSIFASPLAAAQAGQMLVSTLLLGQPSNYTRRLRGADHQPSPRVLRAAQEFMAEHAHRPITVDDLARALKLSTRSVYAAFRAAGQGTPMEQLKDIRMAKAHTDLQRPQDTRTVTEIAMAWGFTHLGNFSRDYRARFGELPSATLRRATRRA